MNLLVYGRALLPRLGYVSRTIAAGYKATPIKAKAYMFLEALQTAGTVISLFSVFGSKNAETISNEYKKHHPDGVINNDDQVKRLLEIMKTHGDDIDAAVVDEINSVVNDSFEVALEAISAMDDACLTLMNIFGLRKGQIPEVLQSLSFLLSIDRETLSKYFK